MVSVQEGVWKVTIEGYQSLINWTFVESAMSNAQHIDEIHWHHHDTLPDERSNLFAIDTNDHSLFFCPALLGWAHSR